MANFKKTNYKFWHSPIALVFLFVALVFFGYKIIDLIKKDMETTHNKDLVLDQITSLRERETSLNTDISKLGTAEGKEEIIRDKYQVAKQGEEMVTIVDNNSGDNSQSQTGTVSHGFWAFIKKLFKF
jgi:cell division protein FtsB